MANGEKLKINISREGSGKSACYVPDGFRGVETTEWSEVLSWEERFYEKSRRAAEEVLKRSDAPIESTDWAKRILKQ